MKSEGGEAAEDMSSIHEGAESPEEEARETKLEKEGYEETKAGKMIKSAKRGVEKVSKKMQDHYKENVKFVTPSPKLGEVKDLVEGLKAGTKKLATAPFDAAENIVKGGMTKSQETVKTAMSKFKKGKLHSGSKKGPVVKSRKQAIAIALSEAGKSKKK
jgi:hypothetical protein